MRTRLIAIVAVLAAALLGPSAAFAAGKPVITSPATSPFVTHLAPSLTWNEVADASFGYHVQRADGDCASNPAVFTTVAGGDIAFAPGPVTFVDTSVTTDGTYCYLVQSDDGLPVASDPVTITFSTTSVSVTAPVASAVVSGSSVLVTANATGDSGVTGVEFFAQGSGSPISLGSDTDTSDASYSVAWDTTSVPDGVYTVWAVATDGASVQTTSAPVGSVHVDNNGPAVSVTSPGSLSVVHGSAVTVSATATDSAGGTGVQSVAFLAEAQGSLVPIPLGSDTTPIGASYSVSWDTTTFAAFPDGLYTVWAVATDGATHQTTSGVVGNVRVDNTAPTVSMTAPANSSVVHGGGVTVSADATDPVGGSGVTSVEFFAQGSGGPISLGSDTTPIGASYSVSWNTAGVSFPDGVYVVWAVATDGATNHTASAIVGNVQVDNGAPTVSVTAPTTAVVVHGANVAVSATATDAPGGTGVADVTFFAQGTGPAVQLGVSGGSPYGVVWDTTNGFPDGLYTVTAVARDGATHQTTSAPIASVRVDNTAPAVSVTTPVASAVVHGSTVAVNANASDGGAGVASVAFFAQGAGAPVSLGVDTGNPYGVVWDTTGVPDGLYSVSAVATDGATLQTTSLVIANVRVDNTQPTVTLSGILDGAKVGGSVALSAAAADTGGSGVLSVQFGQRPAGSSGAYTNIGAAVTSAPYDMSWVTSGLADGLYQVRALATDVATNTQQSSVTNVLVDNHLPAAPAAPTGLSPVSAAPTITFNPSTDPLSSGVASGVDHYDVYRGGVKVNVAPIPDTGAPQYNWSDVVGQSSNPASGTQTYSYTVKAVDAAGNVSVASGARLIVLDPAAVSAPTSVTAVASPTNQRPQVSWGPPVAPPFTVDHYDVYRNSGGTPVASVLASSPTSFTDTTPSLPDGSYAYQLVAVASDGTTAGVASGAVTVVYDTTAPAAPTGVSAAAALDGSVSIGWAASGDGSGSGVARYVVRRSLSSTPPANVADGDATCQVTTTSCGDATTLTGKLYSYAVFAIDRAGNTSLAGNSSAVTARDQLPPAKPTGFGATPGNGTVDLHWAAAGADDDVAGYVLVAKPGSQAPATETDGTRVCAAVVAGSTACTATGLTNGATYTFGLFALDEALNRSQPATVSAAPNGKVVDTKAPAAVSQLKAKVSGHTVTLTWKNPADRDFDHVEVTAGDRKPAALKASKRVYSGKGTRATITLAPGQSRWFVVVAYDAAGNASSPVSIRAAIAPASKFGPAPRAKVHGKVRLTWPVKKGARYYNVQVFVGKKRVFVGWPGHGALQLPKGKLKRGKRYTWYVWPGIGAKAKAHYGKLIGRNVFTFTG